MSAAGSGKADRTAGQAFARGGLWLLAALVLAALGFVFGSLLPPVAYTIFIPIYVFAFWGVVWLIRGVVRWLLPARGAR